MQMGSKLWQRMIRIGRMVKAYIIFLGLLFLVGLRSFAGWFKKFKVPTEKIENNISALMFRIDGKREGDVSRVYLIELALRNIKTKKTRAIVTIGGVAVGVAAIVFLVSLGYGLEKLVISRVARLEELKMVDIGLGVATSVKMNDEVVEKLGKIVGVEEVIPVVSNVSKVNFNNSVTDLMAMGVDERYLKSVDAKIIAGEQFKNKEAISEIKDTLSGEVAGATIEKISGIIGDKVNNSVVRFNVKEGEEAWVWKECDRESEFLGITTRVEGGLVGEEIWGENYYVKKMPKMYVDNQGKEVSKWMRAMVPMWKEVGEELVPVLDGSNQKWELGCVIARDLYLIPEKIEGYKSLDQYLSGQAAEIAEGEVLGVTTEATGAASEASPSADLFETVVATDSAGVEWIEMKKIDNGVDREKRIEYQQKPVGEAYVSSGMMKLWGLSKDKAVGQVFKVTQIIPDGLIPGTSGKIMSEEVDYKVAGVVDDDNSNYFYYQIGDAKLLGVKNYSQIKLLAKAKEGIADIRKEVETMGLKTSSTLDTVSEIEKLFGTLRLLLGFLGMIALAVAALGMFNTMTVSLLERTREVGVMKAMGMLSDDVKELFLAESMIMGVGGGLFGLVLGWLMGIVLSLILTSISVVKGQGVISVSCVPWFLAVFIMLVSTFVGMITGWYPSKRARQISALNALRYE